MIGYVGIAFAGVVIWIIAMRRLTDKERFNEYQRDLDEKYIDKNGGMDK